MTHSALISEGGRIVIPAKLRKAVGLQIGDTVIVRLTDDGLVITTPERAIQSAQALVRQYISPERRLTDELLAERRLEAHDE